MDGRRDRRLDRARRLPARPDFDRVFAAPDHRLRRHPFTLLARYREDPSPSGSHGPRLGLVVGRRHARRAIDRNRIKRRIREAFRHAAPALPPIDVIVLARPNAAASTNPELGAALTWLFERLIRQAADPHGVRRRASDDATDRQGDEESS